MSGQPPPTNLATFLGMPPATGNNQVNSINPQSGHPQGHQRVPVQMPSQYGPNINHTYGQYPSGRAEAHTLFHPTIQPQAAVHGAHLVAPLLPCASRPKTLKTKLSIFATPLKVIVGENQTEFFIQKGIIINESDFFKAACNDHWESGKSNEVVLKEDDPKIFGIFLTWLLTKSIDNSNDMIVVPEARKRDWSQEERLSAATGRYSQLLNFYFYASFLQSTGFQNHVMDSIIALCKDIFYDDNDLVGMREDELVRIFKNTEESSPLRRFVLDYFLKCVRISNWVLEHGGSKELHDPDLGFFEKLVQLSIKMARINVAPVYPWQKLATSYHV